MTIDRPTFATTRVRAGYDPHQVDRAVDMVRENLALSVPRIGPADLADLRFSTVSYRLGYDIEQVDDWLDDVADELGRRSGSATRTSSETTAPPPAHAEAAYPPVTRSDAIVEVRGGTPRWLWGIGLLVVLTVVFYVLYA